MGLGTGPVIPPVGRLVVFLSKEILATSQERRIPHGKSKGPAALQR